MRRTGKSTKMNQIVNGTKSADYFKLKTPFKTRVELNTTETKGCNFYGPIKVKDIDINKTVKELKDHLYSTLNLSSQISRNRLGIMVVTKKDSKEIHTFLSDDYQKLIFYDGVGDSNSIFHLKDIGPQINYRLVYVLEYLGSLITINIFLHLM